jgi:hypothetical protein
LESTGHQKERKTTNLEKNCFEGSREVRKNME